MSARYNVVKTDDGSSYQFVTDSGITYVAYFTEFSLLEYDGNDFPMFFFGFTCDSYDSVKRHDGRVRLTIIHIVQEFFVAQPDDALLYMCVNGDGLGRNRQITFGRWFAQADSQLEKHNFASKHPNEAFLQLYNSAVEQPSKTADD